MTVHRLINKVKSVNIFQLLWFVTVFLLIASLILITLTDSEGGYQPWRSISVNLFLANILIGTVAFLIIAISLWGEQKYRRVRLSKLARRYSFATIIIYVLVYSFVFAIAGYDSYRQRQIEAMTLDKSVHPSQSDQSTAIVREVIPTTTSRPTTLSNKVNTDPIISCNIHANCGGGSRQVKQSECNNLTCCNFDLKCGGSKLVTKAECSNSYCCFLRDGTAKLLSSKSACDNYYTNNSSGATSTYTYKSPTYPPCVVYYPTLGYSTTYSYTSPEDCRILQETENARGKNVLNTIPGLSPTLAPQPTIDQTAQLRISRCKSACISTVDAYMAQLRTNCMAGGKCDNITSNTRDARISQCQSQCW